MTFVKGESGNPAGRPLGSKNRQTLLEQALLEGEGEAIMRRLIDNALENEKLSLRLCTERMVPRMKAEARAKPFELPPINSVADLLPALSAIQAGVASGELSPAEAAALSDVVNRWTTAVQAVEFDARLRQLKEARNGNQAAPES
jgi:hypothetical protein